MRLWEGYGSSTDGSLCAALWLRNKVEEERKQGSQRESASALTQCLLSADLGPDAVRGAGSSAVNKQSPFPVLLVGNRGGEC